MFKGFKILKTYYKLAKLNPYIIFFEFLFLLIPSVLSVISIIVSANIITSITVYDFDRAVFLLSVDFAFIVASALSYFFYHLLNNRTVKTIVINFQNLLYSNIKSNPNAVTMSMTSISNIKTLADFSKNILYKTCFLIKSVILLTIILHYNLIISLVLVMVSFLSYFLFNITDTKIKNLSSDLSKYQIQQIDLFNSIRKGKSVEENYNIEQTLKDKYFGYVDTSVKTSNKIAFFYNINNNFITLILKISVFIATLFLLGLVKSTTLTLSLYLILTPYLSSSAQNLIAFFDIFSEFGIVETILDEFEALKFQEKSETPSKIDFSTFNIYFFQTTLSEQSQHHIHDVDLKIKFGESVNFVGDSACGKRAIFQMLTKQTKPTKGSIFIDSKNISDIDYDKFKTLVTHTSRTPYFYNISIFENLMLVCQNKSKIISGLKLFKLDQEIGKLPNKLNTIVGENFNQNLLYFLGIFRCFLSDAKIINIYSLPTVFSLHEKDLLGHIFKTLKHKRTVIFYSHTDEYSSLFNQTFYIEKGKILNSKNS